MTTITINDLMESKDLDQDAMAATVGGHGIHFTHVHRRTHRHFAGIRVHMHRGPFGIRYPHLHLKFRRHTHYRRVRHHIL